MWVLDLTENIRAEENYAESEYEQGQSVFDNLTYSFIILTCFESRMSHTINKVV